MNLKRWVREIYKCVNINEVKIGNYNGGLNFIFHGNNIKVHSGKYSYGVIHVYSYQKIGEINIGNYTSISEITIIIGGNHHTDLTTYPMKAVFMGYPFEKDNKPAKSVVIKNDVWIGLNAIILEGVTVGNGAIIGAGTVVARDIPDYAVAVGNPAKIIRYRFPTEQIDKLINLKWWTLDKEEIEEVIDLLYDNDIEKFTKIIEENKLKKDIGFDK